MSLRGTDSGSRFTLFISTSTGDDCHIYLRFRDRLVQCLAKSSFNWRTKNQRQARRNQRWQEFSTVNHMMYMRQIHGMLLREYTRQMEMIQSSQCILLLLLLLLPHFSSAFSPKNIGAVQRSSKKRLSHLSTPSVRGLVSKQVSQQMYV